MGEIVNPSVRSEWLVYSDRRRQIALDYGSAGDALSSYSVAFSSRIISALMLVNSGALLIFPTLFDRDGNFSAIEREITGTSVYFVFGFVLSICSAYLGYINYERQRRSTLCERNVLLHDIDKLYAEIFRNITEGYEENYREKMVRDGNRDDLWVSITFWLANVFGVASTVVFCLACWQLGVAIR